MFNAWSGPANFALPTIAWPCLKTPKTPGMWFSWIVWYLCCVLFAAIFIISSTTQTLSHQGHQPQYFSLFFFVPYFWYAADILADAKKSRKHAESHFFFSFPLFLLRFLSLPPHYIFSSLFCFGQNILCASEVRNKEKYWKILKLMPLCSDDRNRDKGPRLISQARSFVFQYSSVLRQKSLLTKGLWKFALWESAN